MNKTQASDQARVAVAGYSDGYRDGVKRIRKELRKTQKRVAELQAFYRDAITEVTDPGTYREVSNRVAQRMANDHEANTGDDSLKGLVDMMKVIDQAMRGMENAKQPGEPEGETKQEPDGEHADEFHLEEDRPGVPDSTQDWSGVEQEYRDPGLSEDRPDAGLPEGSEQDDPDTVGRAAATFQDLRAQDEIRPR